MLSQILSIEGKLHEDVHLVRLLADHELAVVSRWELVKPEEAEVGEDLVQGRIVAISATWVALEENSCENLKRDNS